MTDTRPGALAGAVARADATRRSYDTVAVDYQRLLADQLEAAPLDRAVLAAFAEKVAAGAEADGRPAAIADLGCGTGRVTERLRQLGAEAFGIDLSPGMVRVARETYPGLRFEVGSMTALDLPDGSLGGVLSWYSTVHMDEDELTVTFAEFGRVLAPGGLLLLAFKATNGPERERRRLERAYGHAVDLDVYRWSPEHVVRLLAGAGLVESARLVREPEPGDASPQGFVLARRPRTA
ncbi:class I SAM-dependent methyltransferase [Streptomyces sp. CC208A]|uniref:class I SAM-dependent methyltransferase n=1 Tax=Streptomyces sp. CC208A TaxID=3044573 RepID=UPI0024A8CBBD|nr:class I SAM-dependent methyltransferase [Streptomyces sp. CC208A]